jgi:5-methylcytosine-specific restriction endonuclease McrA
MVDRRGSRGDGSYRRNRARVLRDTDVCWICGQWIDPTLVFPHPGSKVADHHVPWSKGGSNQAANLRAAHHECNTARGDGTIGPPLRTSRNWFGP